MEYATLLMPVVVALLGLGLCQSACAQAPKASRRQSYSGHHGVVNDLPVSHHHLQQHHQDDQPEPLEGPGLGHEGEDHDEEAGAKEPAQYSFGYSVQDDETGDLKSQHETRQGDVVTGRYALREPDGRLRIVTYTADAVNGFNAVVRSQGEPTAAGTHTNAHLANPASLANANPANANPANLAHARSPAARRL